jgi:hypothetical protein
MNSLVNFGGLYMYIFNASKPYDMNKLLFQTILGSERRAKVIEQHGDNEFVIKFENSKSIGTITFDNLNYDFINKLFLEKTDIYDYEDYGKIFYEYARVAFCELALTTLNIDDYFAKEQEKDSAYAYPKFVAEYADEFDKINQSITVLWKQFIDKVNLSESYKKAFTILPDTVGGILSSHAKSRENFYYYDISNDDLLTAAYAAQLFLISGILLLITSKGYIRPEDVFNENFNNVKAVDIIKEVAKSDLDDDTKVKFFTLSLSFFYLNRYLRIYSGVSFNDPIVNIIATFGYAVADSLKNENDFKFIEPEFLEGFNNTKVSFLGFTTRYDALRNIESYFNNFSIKNDHSIPWEFGAHFINNAVSYNPEILKEGESASSIVSVYTPVIKKFIETNDTLSDYIKDDDLSIERGFNYIRDFFNGANNDKITMIDPFVFYQVTLVVSTFRYIKNTASLYSHLNDEKKNKIIFGIWMGDALLYILYNQWFVSGKFYEQVKRPKYCEDLVQTTLSKLREEVNVVVFSYFEFLKFDGKTLSSDDIAYYENYSLLYERSRSQGLTSAKIMKYFGTDAKLYAEAIKNQKTSILFEAVVSDITDKFNVITSMEENPVDISSDSEASVKDKLLNKLSAAEPTAETLDDPLLSRICTVAEKIDSANLGSTDYLMFVVVPFLSYMEKTMNKFNIGSYFDFITPDVASKTSNYEYILNEAIVKRLSYKTSLNAIC